MLGQTQLNSSCPVFSSLQIPLFAMALDDLIECFLNIQSGLLKKGLVIMDLAYKSVNKTTSSLGSRIEIRHWALKYFKTLFLTVCFSQYE